MEETTNIKVADDSAGRDKNVLLNSDLPTFAQLAEYKLSQKGPREKNITIKVEAATARMMIENEKKLLGI